MLTDERARELLHLAAETVEVGAAPQVVVPARRPWWPAAAAVVAVLALASVVAVVGTRDGRQQPTPPPAGPDDGVFRLGPDQVPSVFGYDRAAAVAMLEERGFAVRVVVVPNECDETPGRTMSIEPRTGTVVTDGSEVTLNVAGDYPPTMDCKLDVFQREKAWALIDYANGRAEAPPTAPGVDLAPAIERLRVWSNEVGRFASGSFGTNQMRWPTPTLTTMLTYQPMCGVPEPFAGREGLAISVAVDVGPDNAMGPEFGPCHTVVVDYADDGTILDVGVPGFGPADDRLLPADVVGNTLSFATERLATQGLKVEPIGRADCQPVGVVTAQEPGPYEVDALPPGSTVVLAFTAEAGRCLDQRSAIPTPSYKAARLLVGFARGGPLPPVAAHIDLYVASSFEKRLDRDVAADHEAWGTGCGSPTGRCFMNMLDTFASGPAVVTQPSVPTNDACHVVRGTLPEELTDPDGLRRSASFGVAEPRTCAVNWEAQLWLDVQDRIKAVNVVLGKP